MSAAKLFVFIARPQKIFLLANEFFPVRLIRAILLPGHLIFPFFPPLNGM